LAAVDEIQVLIIGAAPNELTACALFEVFFAQGVRGETFVQLLTVIWGLTLDLIKEVIVPFFLPRLLPWTILLLLFR
jgi:hypothetical protein